MKLQNTHVWNVTADVSVAFFNIRRLDGRVHDVHSFPVQLELRINIKLNITSCENTYKQNVFYFLKC